MNQIAKLGLSDAIVDDKQKKNGTADFTTEELKNLFKFHEKTDCDTHDLLQCPCCTASTVCTPTPIPTLDMPLVERGSIRHA